MSVAPENDSDARDMQRLADGCDTALDDLMDRHAPKLHNYLRRALQDEEDAADLAQETFVRVYRNRARFDPGHRFSTWLYAIASNLVRDRLRWRSRHPQVPLEAPNPITGSDYASQLADPTADPVARAEKAEKAEAVRTAIQALPEELRLPLILAEYEELSQSEIAAILDCSVKAVETRIYRARKRLRAALAPLLASA